MAVQLKSNTSFLIRLSAVSPSDAARAGAKASNEADMLAGGFIVPDGFILTTDAFERFLAFNNIGSDGAPDSIANAPMPLDVVEVLEHVARELDDGPLAVRSSAMAEDLPGASFAGQYESILNVPGGEALEVAVRRCWGSIFREHVAAYRRRQGLELSPMAVLIQKMIAADAAGVAFTANPVSGARGEVVINAVRGLGERLVSGEASPDEWVVRGTQAKRLKAPEDAIDEAHALTIAETARKVEAFFGSPQDIEWVLAEEQLYLLQARPITTLSESRTQTIEMIPIPIEVPPGYWIRNATHQPQPTTPMHRSVFGKYVRAAAMQMFDDFGVLIEGFDMKDIGGWEYIRMVPLGGKDGPALPSWMMWLLVRIVPMMRRRIRKSITAVQTDIAGDFMQRWYSEWQKELETRIAEIRDVDLEQLSDQELADHLDATETLFARAMEIRSPHHIAEAIIMYEFVGTCEELLGWDEQQSFELVSGFSFKSTEPARELYEMAQMARNRPAVRAVIEDPASSGIEQLAEIDEEFAAVFEDYMNEYGCRALRYEVADPTLLETPSLVLELIRGQLVREFNPDKTQDELAQKRAAAESKARKALQGRLKDLSRFESILERARFAYPVREDSEFFCVSAPLALLRFVLLEIGSRLAEPGIIDQGNDVFFLGLDEVRSAFSVGGKYKEVIKRRQAERAWAEAHQGPPSYGPEPPPMSSLDFLPKEARQVMEAMMWYFDPDEEAGGTTQSGAIMSGTAVSPGEYTGPVRVIMHEGEFHKLQPGDVLVCPTTSPVWSVLFPSVGALVADTGAMLSHPAIIAREYQVPAVLALGNATSLLHDGELVTVDGSKGIVKRLI